MIKNKKLSFRVFYYIGFTIYVLFVGIYFTVFMFAERNFDLLNVPRENLCASNTDCSVTVSSKSNYVFLISGIDNVSKLSDVLLLVNLNIENSSIAVVQIPRDTYLKYTNQSYRKINAAAKTLGGSDKLAELLEDVFKIEIDYTLEISLDALSQFVDLIGGVEVNIPCDMDYEDGSQNLNIHLKSGVNVLNGDAAAQFVRFRSGYVQGDVARINAQKIFMASLADKCIHNVSKYKIPALIGALIGNVNTNLSFNACIELAQAVMDVDISNITMLTLAGADSRTRGDHGAWYYIVNRATAIDTMNIYFKSPNSKITEEEFDTNRLLGGDEYDHFAQIYDSTDYSVKEYRADSIIKDGIDIDLINN